MGVIIMVSVIYIGLLYFYDNLKMFVKSMYHILPFSWSANPTTRHSIWALFIGSYVGQLTIYAANQTMIQRYLAIQYPGNSQKYV